MSDYGVRSGDERTPLTRAFVEAFARAMEARDALATATDEQLDPVALADRLADQLMSATRRLARNAMAWTGAAGEPDIAAAQYAFVALLDELLLFSDWPGGAVWEARPLEVRVFGTRSAGERLPDAIEALLAQRDASQRDLANVYLACLMLGFKGRLRGAQGALRHDQLRHALFAFAMQRDADPTHLGAPFERIAVAPRRAVTLTQMFPDIARFGMMLGIGVCVMLGISHLLWSIEMARVWPAVTQFQNVAAADARPAQADAASAASASQSVPASPHAQARPTAVSGDWQASGRVRGRWMQATQARQTAQAAESADPADSADLMLRTAALREEDR